MGRRVAVELLHIAAGLLAAWAITAAAAWAYPLGRDVIWWCGAAAMAATVFMGVGPLRRAHAADRAERS
jgi:fatty acid desaturase